MKYTLSPSTYSFNASAGTITFTGTIPADINNILHITNVTRGVIYFQPQASFARSGSYSSPLLTLNASTVGHSNTDNLFIVYDDGIATYPITDNNSSLTVDGRSYRATRSFNRPADTTAYSAGDVIGTSSSAIHEIASIGPSGGYILIQSVSLFIDNSSVPSGMGAFRIHFYDASPTAITDNSVFSLEAADQAKYLGYVDLSRPQDLGATIYTQGDGNSRVIKLASGQTSLWVEIETRGAYTPLSGTAYELHLSTMEAGL